MTRQMVIKNSYDSLNTILAEVKRLSPYEASLVYDTWDMRTDKNNQMEKCILLKKSNMHGLKLHLEEGQQLHINHVIPNKIMQAYFGKSQKRYKNILEIVTGKIAELALADSQKKAFEEMYQSLAPLAK